MTSIAHVDIEPTTLSPRQAARRWRALWRLVRRAWHRRAWRLQLRRELRDPRLLADIGQEPGSEAREVPALARTMLAGRAS